MKVRVLFLNLYIYIYIYKRKFKIKRLREEHPPRTEMAKRFNSQLFVSSTLSLSLFLTHTPARVNEFCSEQWFLILAFLPRNIILHHKWTTEEVVFAIWGSYRRYALFITLSGFLLVIILMGCKQLMGFLRL